MNTNCTAPTTDAIVQQLAILDQAKLVALLRTPDGTDTYPRFRDRLIALVKKANDIYSEYDGTAADGLYELLYDMEGTDEEAWVLE